MLKNFDPDGNVWHRFWFLVFVLGFFPIPSIPLIIYAIIHGP